MLKKITKPFILYIKKTEDGYKNRFGQVFRLSKKKSCMLTGDVIYWEKQI